METISHAEICMAGRVITLQTDRLACFREVPMHPACSVAANLSLTCDTDTLWWGWEVWLLLFH